MPRGFAEGETVTDKVLKLEKRVKALEDGKNRTIRIEICQSLVVEGKWNVRVGDIGGATEVSNTTKEEVLDIIKIEMEALESPKDV